MKGISVYAHMFLMECSALITLVFFIYLARWKAEEPSAEAAERNQFLEEGKNP